LLFHTCTTSHSTAPTGCSLPFAPHLGYRCASDSAVTSMSQCSAVTAWHGVFLCFSLQVPPSRPLGRAWYCRTRFSLSLAQLLRPERLCTILICASLSMVMLCCKAVYGGRLWRPVLILELHVWCSHLLALVLCSFPMCLLIIITIIIIEYNRI
jgi:hypothetical protein